jgi:ADP-L-glycero-D-manno-heptose 6-epimerase
MIIVTGGAGLIGSNLIAQLNLRGHTDILVVDHLKNGQKMHNLADLHIRDYLDRDDFMARVLAGQDLGQVSTVFHLGACSATTEWDGQFMMRNNFEYSKTLLHWCQTVNAQYIYASSASVYGLGKHGFSEQRDCELPINMYAYSKFQFDQYVRSLQGRLRHQVVGLRYFNVYGPREQHKGRMASVAFHQFHQLREQGHVKLFADYGGYAAGEQERDFVFIDDVVAVNLWFFDHPTKNGLFNLGTGRAQPFNDVALAVVNAARDNKQEPPLPLAQAVKAESIRYIDFPDALRGKYQCFTQADLSALRASGCDHVFADVQTGVTRYMHWLAHNA